MLFARCRGHSHSVGLSILQQRAHPLNLASESYCKGIISCWLGKTRLVVLTAVTFLTLRAVMPLSPPCLASIAASFMRLSGVSVELQWPAG